MQSLRIVFSGPDQGGCRTQVDITHGMVVPMVDASPEIMRKYGMGECLQPWFAVLPKIFPYQLSN